MRKAPLEKPAPLNRKSDDEREIVRETRRYRFLTYVMGGGVKVDDHDKHRDERTPVRVASIRGQLRFWWRACNPSNCRDVEALRAREALIWGSTEEHSRVTITVKRQLGAPEPYPVYQYNERTGKLRFRPDHEDLAYGAFPLQPSSEFQKVRADPGVLYDYGNQEFEIEFIYLKSVEDDVRAALWAWETFGGLGARTRRGFGAIERVGAASTIEEIRARLQVLRRNNVIEDLPSLAGARLELAPRVEPKSSTAWTSGLRTLRQLRQGKGLGRNWPQPDTTSPAGRSRWPEPEAIRKLTGQRLPKHGPLQQQADRFPRGAFGMPIVFHFQAGARDASDRTKDPADTELKPANADRMASPLIIRPIRDGKGFRAAALVLTATIPKQLVLKTKDKKKDPPTVSVVLDRKHAEQIEPMKVNGLVLLDPLDRFLEELKK